MVTIPSRVKDITNQVFDRLTVKPEYPIWMGIKARCNNENNFSYDRYGERGIVLCDRWMETFVNFYEDMGKRPNPWSSVDRINNNGNYSCGKCEQCIKNGWVFNCKWSTPLEQANNRENNVNITYNGETKTASEWSKYLGFARHIVGRRYREGWTVEECMQPLGYQRSDISKARSLLKEELENKDVTIQTLTDRVKDLEHMIRLIFDTLPNEYRNN